MTKVLLRICRHLYSKLPWKPVVRFLTQEMIGVVRPEWSNEWLVGQVCVEIKMKMTPGDVKGYGVMADLETGSTALYTYKLLIPPHLGGESHRILVHGA